MRYRTLTEEEKATLQEMKNATRSKILLPRIECILLSHQGMRVKAPSAYLEVVPKTIYEWMDLWEKDGISGILPKGGSGSKKKLSNIAPWDGQEKFTQFSLCFAWIAGTISNFSLQKNWAALRIATFFKKIPHGLGEEYVNRWNPREMSLILSIKRHRYSN